MSDTTATELYQLTVAEEEDGQRIDALLAKHLNSYSRVFLRKVVHEGGGRIDGETVKPSFRVRTGHKIEVDLPPVPTDGPRPEAIPLSILFEDDHFVVVDKPPAMVVHPAKGHWQGTLTSALAHRFQELSDVGGPTRPGVVHRLDRDTSGVIVVAKSNSVHLALAAQFEARTVQKEYFAITLGKIGLDRDIIRVPIGPHPYQRDKMTVRTGHPQSRDAETWYEVQERFDGFTVVKLAPKTGRTHQIRVHLSHIGAPVLCDRLYAGHAQITRGQLARRLLKKDPPQPNDDEVVLARQALHARRLELNHPTSGERMVFESPLPPDIAGTLAALRQT